MEQFKKDTDPKEHVRQYKSAIALYVLYDALLCLNFPQTLGIWAIGGSGDCP